MVAVGVTVGACSVEAEDPSAATPVALTSIDVRDYAAVAPPEGRVATDPIPARFGVSIDAGRRLAAIRTMTLEGKRARLVVDVDSYATSVVLEADLASHSHADSGDRLASAPYLKSLEQLSSRGAALESIDHDARAATSATEPFALTIDMCQSRKPFERRLFEWAVTLADQLHAPVPVGIAMTGVWAKAHASELEQILAWESAGKLSITWINHSSTHPLHCQNASCSKAEFLTAQSVDFDEEVFGLERALISRGLVPSPIFRFPGLVHDAERMRQLSRLSLMAIDADGWIAKGQGIKPGAVVLVHGNGNEPEGITAFLRAVQGGRAQRLRAGETKLVPPILIAPEPPR